MTTLVGAKPREVLSLSKNERLAAGGRRSGGTDHFGRPALEGQLPEVGGRRWRSVFLRFSRGRLLTQISSAVGGRRSGSSFLGSFLLGILLQHEILTF